MPKHQFTVPHIAYMENTYTVSGGSHERSSPTLNYEGSGGDVGGSRQSHKYSFGNDEAHENMPPYQTLYYWLRTA